METKMLKGTLERNNFADLKLNSETNNQETQIQEDK